jgi:hypothetical protein
MLAVCTVHPHFNKPNVVVVWCTLLLPFQRSRFKLSVRRRNIVIEGFRQYLQQHVGIVTSIRARPLPSTLFSFHHSLINTLSFDAIYQGWPQRGSRTSLGRLAQDTFNNVGVFGQHILFDFSPQIKTILTALSQEPLFSSLYLSFCTSASLKGTCRKKELTIVAS